MRHRLKTLVLLTSCALALAACGNRTGSVEPGPVGIGGNVQTLRGTPCACVEIEMVLPTSALSSIS